MKKRLRTELIFEIAKGQKNSQGFSRTTKKYLHDIKQTDIKISNQEASKKLEREIGNYINFNFNDLLFFDVKAKEILTQKLQESIKNLVKLNGIKPKKVLVVGLGNEKYACDSLGKSVVDRILVTKPYLDKGYFDADKMAEIYAISLGVYGTTGLDSSQTIKSICKMIEPDLVVAIDSLVASQTKNLALSIQVTDTKLSPGGGVGNNRQEVSKALLHVNVIAIGVPLVVNLSNICPNSGNLIVTPKDVEEKVSVLSKIIAKAINLCFCKLTKTEYLELTS